MVDRVAAEDTRQTAKLLSHYGIDKPTTSYHAFNLQQATPRLIHLLENGESLALVSDAGMPGISDPGHELVVAAIEAGIKVVPIPGATASLSALVISGLPSDHFYFEGFLPREGKARRRRIREIINIPYTMIMYEGPHRLLDTLRDLLEGMGDRRIALCRELTKVYEETLRMTLSEAIKHYEANEPRGEFTLVLEGGTVKAPEGDPRQLLERYLNEGLSKAEASKRAAKDLGLSKREIYQLAIEKD